MPNSLRRVACQLLFTRIAGVASVVMLIVTVALHQPWWLVAMWVFNVALFAFTGSRLKQSFLELDALVAAGREPWTYLDDDPRVTALMDNIPDEIPPNLAPCSYVLRFYAPSSGRMVAEQRLPPGPAMGTVQLNSRRGEEGPPVMAVYDGDDGELITVCLAMTLNLHHLMHMIASEN